MRNYTVRLILSDGNSFIYFVRFIPKADFKIGELRRMYFYAYSIIQNSVPILKILKMITANHLHLCTLSQITDLYKFDLLKKR